MRSLAVLVAVLVLTAGCGGSKSRDAAPGATGTTPTGTTSSSPAPTPTAAPRRNLPTSYPQDAVPLIDGAVTSRTQGSLAQGWVVHLNRAGSQQACFDAAAARLVAHGFTQQAEVVHVGLVQAQFTSAKYAVVLMSGAPPGRKKCSLQYTVGALGG